MRDVCLAERGKEAVMGGFGHWRWELWKSVGKVGALAVLAFLIYVFGQAWNEPQPRLGRPDRFVVFPNMGKPAVVAEDGFVRGRMLMRGGGGPMPELACKLRMEGDAVLGTFPDGATDEIVSGLPPEARGGGPEIRDGVIGWAWNSAQTPEFSDDEMWLFMVIAFLVGGIPIMLR